MFCSPGSAVLLNLQSYCGLDVRGSTGLCSAARGKIVPVQKPSSPLSLTPTAEVPHFSPVWPPILFVLVHFVLLHLSMVGEERNAGSSQHRDFKVAIRAVASVCYLEGGFLSWVTGI